ncbi:MAG: hypothetical protein PHY41_03260 [Candidatus Cloacimonetes bacterium]|jgi:hypothetical protein|nr:hypothetical protein [Candidatus Cloacimonadota bacterium]MDY0299357.1 hypothetical protein [Candidatus Cloacimonadaceae bacterium]MCB5278770.1 hypothetical protein [Candidatus Cloacimonadota bacterium]MCK9331720.1 hypothetical protein [Candidatus Cloacimonadota bacterium]MDD2210876.1 hypothetical protein [Candidatus Cloacimonadota bacterium]
MRIWLFLLAILFTLSACFVSSSLLFSEADIQDSKNLLANPGFAPFSLNPNEALKGWSVHVEPFSADYDKIRIDPKEALQGDTSLMISASDKDILLISEPFKVRRYGGYYSRVMVKSDSPSPPQITMQMITFKDNGKITNRFKERFTPNSIWNRIAVSAGFLRPGVSFGRLSIQIEPFAEGSVWIDDAGCWEVHGFKID